MKEAIEALISRYEEELTNSRSMRYCMTESESDMRYARESALECFIDDLEELLNTIQ